MPAALWSDCTLGRINGESAKILRTIFGDIRELLSHWPPPQTGELQEYSIQEDSAFGNCSHSKFGGKYGYLEKHKQMAHAHTSGLWTLIVFITLPDRSGYNVNPTSFPTECSGVPLSA